MTFPPPPIIDIDQHSEKSAAVGSINNINPALVTSTGGTSIRLRTRSERSPSPGHMEAGQVIDVVNNGGTGINREGAPNGDPATTAGPLNVPTNVVRKKN